MSNYYNTENIDTANRSIYSEFPLDNYLNIDTLENINISDSYVFRSQKIGNGSGEKKLYVGQKSKKLYDFFGGEGFIMQKLEGDGMSFIHAGGTLAKKTLGPGEVLKVDTGCIVGFTKDVDYDIEFVGGIRNTVFGGEGLFFATLRGPGTVYIQSLPFSRLAGRVLASIPRGGKDKGEGSILGTLGDIVGGDTRF